MPTDTITPTLVINKLTKAQYEGIVNPSDTELYLVPDDDPSTPVYRGSYNIITDLELTVDALESTIITALASEISAPQYANYCFVDIPYANYSEVSGWASFSTVNDYIGYYILVNGVYVLITAENIGDYTSSITLGTTVAYSVSYTSYFEKILRYRYNGNSWEYEYDVDFSGYSNIDASNFTDSGTTYLSKIGYMDWSRMENLPIPASNTTITAPANGWFWGNITYVTGIATVIFETVDSFNYNLRTGNYVSSSGRVAYALLPVRQGDELTILWSTQGASKKLVFIYAEGTPTPPQP